MPMELPSGDESWVDPIFDAVVSDVQASGYFDKVQQHEPKRRPRKGLTAAIWVQSIEPLGSASGQAATTALLVFIVRMFSNMLKEPQDGIDPELLKAVSNLMRRYHDNFDFGLDPVVRNVDVFGEFGVKLSATAGYEEIDGTVFRIYDLLVPIVVNDVWPQNP